MRLRVTIDSKTFEAAYGGITAEQVRTFNNHLRVTLRETLSDPTTHDLDVVAGLVWLTMPAGTSIEEVFADLTFDAVCVVQLVDEEG